MRGAHADTREIPVVDNNIQVIGTITERIDDTTGADAVIFRQEGFEYRSHESLGRGLVVEFVFIDCRNVIGFVCQIFCNQLCPVFVIVHDTCRPEAFLSRNF